MALGTDGTAGTPLEDSIGALFGEIEAPDSGATATADDGSSAERAGAPPADAAGSQSGASPTSSEANGPGERAGAPPADATTPNADQAPPAGPQDDPLAGATPFTYTVNGQTRTYDGIKVLPELGGIIDPAKLQDLERRLGERDHLFETSRQQYQATQDRDKLTEWTVSRPDGSKETLSGLAADRARMEAHANVLAELKVLKDALADPATFQSLLAFDEANNRVVLNAPALQHLATRAENLAMKMHQSIATRFAGAQQAPRQTTAATDVNAAAPQIVASVVKQLNVSGLTDKDTAKLAGMVPRYIRAATAADRQANPTLQPGEQVMDPAFFDEVRYLAELRAESAATSRTAADATATNTARLAAAARGRPAARTPAPATAPTDKPTNQRAKDAGDAWDMMERLSNRTAAGSAR